MNLLTLVQRLAAQHYIDEDGNREQLDLLPPLTAAEIVELERALPCPLPTEVRELLQYTRGLANSPIESVDFAGLADEAWTELFPAGLLLAHDGFGNHWVVDLVPNSTQWGPIFYVAHDPPVIVYQALDLQTFLMDMVQLWTAPYHGSIDDVHETASSHIWRANPGVTQVSVWRYSPDSLHRAFADSLDDRFLCIDLREARVGDGFSWGRYGAQTVNKRFGWHRLFAYQQRKTWWQRFFSR